jgi:hypothetical protein
VILELHLSAPGTSRATAQMPMPDADHAPAFWSSVASAFKDDHQLIFDLFNEPFADNSGTRSGTPWSCWRDGCTMNPGYGASVPWRAAGMQSLVDAIRGAGASQPIMLGGLRWANDLSDWLAHRPNDPASQLVASYHLYNFNSCVDESCWNNEVKSVAAHVPVITGELGENDCSGGFIDRYMPWADAAGISYLAWTWDTWDCKNGPALISDYNGTPTGFGQAYRAHVQQLRAP